MNPPPPRPAKKIGRKRRAAGWTLLALGVVVAGVWVASHRWMLHYESAASAFNISSGEMAWSLDRGWGFDERGLIVARYWNTGRNSGWHFLHTAYHPNPLRSFVDYRNDQRGERNLAVAIAPIAIILWAAGAPLLRSGIIERRRTMAGHCAKCGYSLAGLAKDAPCPECGGRA